MKSKAFFLGKGGVGKTTLAAAFARALAREGRKTLVVSLDPAHNLGDVLGLRLGDEARAVESKLDALEVSLSSWVERYLADCRDQMKATYSYDLSLNLDSVFNIMKYSPGTEEYAVLWAIEHVQCELAGAYDVVVFDTPPTALSLRFLAMPAISSRWVAELSSLRERILRQRQTITKLNPESPVASGCVDKNDDAVYGRLGAIRQRLRLLETLFRDESYMAVVLNQDELSVSEALRIKAELESLGMGLSAVCVNKRGMSRSAWTPHSAFSGIKSFYFDFVPSGLERGGDLWRVARDGLTADFLRKEGKA